MSGARIDTREARRGLQALAAGIVQAAGLAVRDGIKAAVENAKATTLWEDSGRPDGTRKSIRGERTSFNRGFLEAGGASRFLQNGTPAHWIGSAVKIRGIGWRFIKMHPGTTARPFLDEARARGEWAMHAAAEYYVDEAIQRVR
jgi:hypothetical protein